MIITIEASENPIEILFMCSDKLGEPVAWNGSIVMNTQKELKEVFNELQNGEFIKQTAKYENR